MKILRYVKMKRRLKRDGHLDRSGEIECTIPAKEITV